MKKVDLVQQLVNNNIWKAFKKVYKVNFLEPQTNAQKELVQEISNYVFNTYAKEFTVKEIKEMHDI